MDANTPQAGTPVSTGSEVTSENKQGDQGTPPNPEGSATVQQQLIDITGWDGDINNVPDSLPQKTRDTIKSWRQHFTKKSQEIADIKDYANKYQEFVKSDMYNEFQTWYKSKSEQPTTVNNNNPYSAMGITQDELDAAQLGDTSALMNVVSKVADYKANQIAKEKETQLDSRLQRIDKRDEIRDFADSHEDFWDKYEEFSDVMKSQLSSGKTIEQAYDHVKSLEAKYLQKAQQAASALVTQKKAASAVDGRTTGESDTVWVDTEAEANMKAIELVRSNDNRKVRIRKK